VFLEGIVRVDAYGPTFVARQRWKVSVEDSGASRFLPMGYEGKRCMAS
jgi:hypothetical protein